MRKKVIILPVLIFMLFSCKKDDPTIHLKIEGIVLNSENTEPVAGAKIEIISDKSTETATSDETGYFDLGKFIIGDYIINISKDGFAPNTQQIDAANNISGSGDNGFEVVKSLICNLVPATEEAELTLYRVVNNGERIAAKNFPYVISTGLINSSFKGTTDENGKISLSNVPSVVSIFIDHELNGIRYKTNKSFNIHWDNYLVVHGYSTEANLGIVSASILDDDGKPLENIAIDTTINFQFTMPVDTAKSKIELFGFWPSNEYSHKWTNNNMKLEIIPEPNLNPDTRYEIILNLVSESGNQNFYRRIGFATED